jgi:protein ImuB
MCDDSVPGHGAVSIARLQPTPDIITILSRWGIRTVGQFLALGRNEISERLGTQALNLFKLFSVESVRPLRLVSPPANYSEYVEFENEIETTGPLIFVLRRFVEQVAERLGMIYLVVGQLELGLGLSSGEKYERVFKIPSPTGNVQTLFPMLQTHLDACHGLMRP